MDEILQLKYFEAYSKSQTNRTWDIIVVPEKEYKDRMTFTKEILVIISSAATILLSILTINNYNN
jgi:hypothetical protein